MRLLLAAALGAEPVAAMPLLRARILAAISSILCAGVCWTTGGCFLAVLLPPVGCVLLAASCFSKGGCFFEALLPPVGCVLRLAFSLLLLALVRLCAALPGPCWDAYPWITPLLLGWAPRSKADMASFA